MKLLLKSVLVFKWVLGLWMIFMVSACQASENVFSAGEHYEVLPQPVPTVDASKVEVAEVFWYGCGHCYAFEPLIETWLESKPEHVEFVRVPAVWAEPMVLHAQAYYTAKALKVVDTLHPAIFEAMNPGRQRLQSEGEIAKMFTDNGVSADRFARTFNSFGVKQAATVAQSRLRAYRVQGTPEMVVNGKYRVSTRMVGTQQKMLEVVDFLVAKEAALLQSDS
ncbi:MAG: thiol:disulfide interchange protein DsbA/DsbL [bacterium]